MSTPVTLRLLGENGQLVGVLRSTDDAMGKFRKSTEDTDKSTKKLGDSSRKTAEDLTLVDKGLNSVKSSSIDLAKSLAGGLGLAGVASAITIGITKARDFRLAIAEVSTALSDTSKITQYANQTRMLAREYGLAATDQAKALYEIISAGQTAESAMLTLDTANRLAVGGLTSVEVAADGLTSVLNAYGDRVKSAADISDILFTGAAAGKTNIDQLSSSLGQVAPIAATVGVEFEDLVASIATLTLGGVSTNIAVTQMRSALNALIKPTGEAEKLAEKLGLQFDVAALKSKGLAGFLEDVREKTGGSAEAIATLFGSTEAIAAVLSLTGTQAETFAGVLDQMTERAGKTDVAFGKIAGTADFEFKRAMTGVGDLLIRAGDVMLNVLAPAAKFFADNLDQIGGAISTGATIAAAYLAIFVALPAAYNLATVAGWKFVAMLTAQNVGLLASVKAIGLIKTAAMVLFAAFAGWQIGTYLREQFVAARLAGLFFIEGLLVGWERLKQGGQIAWEAIKATAVGALNTIRTSVAAVLTMYANAAETTDIFGVGAGVIEKIRSVASALTPATDASDDFAAAVARINEEANKQVASIQLTMTELQEYEIAAEANATANTTVAAAADAAADANTNLAPTLDDVEKKTTRVSAAVEMYEDMLKDAARAAEQLSNGNAGYAATVRDMQEELAGVTPAQRNYNRAMEEANALLAEATALGNATPEKVAEIRKAYEDRVAAIEEISTLETALAEKRKLETSEFTDMSTYSAEEFQSDWQRGLAGVGDAWGDFVGRGFKDFGGFVDDVKDSFKRMLADMAAQLATSQLMKMLGSFFGGGGGGGFSFTSALSSMFGGGGGAAGGGGNSVLSMLTSNGSNTLLSNLLQYAPALAAVAGGAYGFTQRGSSNGSAGSIGAGLAYGVAGYAAGTVALGAGLGAAAGAATGVAGAAAGGALAGGAGAAAAIPVVGWIIAAVAAIDMITGGKVFGSRYRAESSTATIGIGAEGGSASLDLVEVRNRSLFQGRQWRGSSMDPGDEAREAAQGLFDAIEDTMTQAARSLQSEVPPVIDAAIRTVTEYDKKGKVKSTKILVDMFGRTWEEATAEAAATRITAESIIATIDYALDGVTTAMGDAIANPIFDAIDGIGGPIGDRINRVMAKAITESERDDVYGWGDETSPLDPTDPGTTPTARAPGEASRIAERWRADADMLMEGAQFLLLAATDIRAGVGLLKDEGGLTAITDLVEELAVSGETLSDTYSRLSAGAQLFDQVFALAERTFDGSREAFVRWTAGVAEAAGGLQRVGELVSQYIQRYFSPEELAQVGLEQTQASAQTEFDDIGLNASDFASAEGMQRLRTMFEENMGTMTEEATVQWLEALVVLGQLVDAQDAYNAMMFQTEEELATINSLLDENAWANYSAGMSTAQRALAEIDRAYETQRETLVANRATMEQLNVLESQRVAALEAQTAALQRQAQDLLNENQFGLDSVNMTSAQRAIAEINRGYAEQARTLQDLGATTAQQTALEIQRITAIEQATAAMQAQIEQTLDSLAFELNIDGLNELELAQARVNAQYDNLREDLIDQGATVEQLTRLEDLRTEALDQATAAIRNNNAALAQFNEYISAFITNLRSQYAQFLPRGASSPTQYGDYQAWIEGVTGFTPNAPQGGVVDMSDTVEMIRQQYAAQIATLNSEMADTMAQLDDTPWYNQSVRSGLQSKIAAIRALLRDVTGAVGDAVDYAEELFAQQLTGLLGGLRNEFGDNDPVADINARFDSLRTQAEAWGATNEELAEIEAYRAEALANLIDDRYESEMRWIRDLMGFRDSLLLDEGVSTLTPQQRLDEARRQYDATLLAAQAGDADAQASFQQIAQRYLEESRSFYGSTQEYSAIFQGVLDSINAMITNGGTPVTIGAGSGTGGGGSGVTTTETTSVLDTGPIISSLTTLNDTTQTQTTRLEAALAQVAALLQTIVELQGNTVSSINELAESGYNRV